MFGTPFSRAKRRISGLTGRLLAAGAILAAAAGCSSSGVSGPGFAAPSATAPIPLFSSAGTAPQVSASPVSACALLMQSDVLAVSAAFTQTTITIDGHNQNDNPPTNTCGFNQKGVYSDNGTTVTSSGDSWAQLTVITGGADYAYRPGSNEKIPGLGDGAYWDPGTHTVVILKGRDVLKVVDEVPVNQNANPDLVAAYRQAAQALAAKIMTHM